MCSSSARTPKLQLSAEQPSIGECWTSSKGKKKKKDNSHPRAKEKPQQDSRRGKIVFRIKLITCQKVSEDSNKTLCTPGPRDATRTEPDLPSRRGRVFLYLVLMCSHHLVDYVAPDSAVQSSQQHLAASFFPGQSFSLVHRKF